jgi:hypothetical protein
VPRFSTLNFVLRGSPNVGAAAKDLRPSGMTHPGGMIANPAQVILSPNGWMVPDAVAGRRADLCLLQFCGPERSAGPEAIARDASDG